MMVTNLPLVSVLMPIYKEPEEQIKSSVESILNQSYKNIELVVIIDDPNNINAINYLRDTSKKDLRVNVKINSRNLGITSGLNRAIGFAKGELIARMDADDISKRDRIYLELQFMKKNKLDLVASNVQSMSQNGKILDGKVTNYPSKDIYIKQYLRYYNCLPHPTWLGKRELFIKLNGYRNIPTCEDYDFLLRGAGYHYKYGLVREPLLYYRENQNSISKSNIELQRLISDFIRKKYIYEKNYTVTSVNKYIDEVLKRSSLKEKLIYNALQGRLLFDRIKGKFFRSLILKKENVKK
ncbi:glycosyltransferase [Limosilactobacillus fermentum]|uniref:glycosyltransferase n=1 Tax=Limosilactobacillus fermentum TaxID=1613 RepID=UPI0022E7CC74|nr:glycosyltransferase [Limosilactobacillus fermentum]